MEGQEVYVPIKPFIYHDFKDWLVGVTAHQGLEEAMDATWDSAKKPDNRGLMHDIFDGDML